MQKSRLNKVVAHLYVPFVLLALGAIITCYNGARLHPGTDVLLAVLDRLQSPGLLSRDLVAANANLSFTAYDEITLLIARLCKHSLPYALQLQSFLCTVGEGAGIHLLASSMKLSRTQSLWAASGTLLLAAAFFRKEPFLLAGEQTPQVFALALTILAVGLLGRRRTVAAGLAGGVALLYDVRMALPFWLLTLWVFARERSLRTMLRPLGWIFLVFALLLANLAQLQPVPSQNEASWTRILSSIAKIDRDRLPWQWISAWPWPDIALFGCLTVAAVGSLALLWRRVDRLLRPYLVGLLLLSLLSIPLTLIFVDGGRFSVFVRAALPAWAAFEAVCCLFFGISALLRRLPAGRLLYLQLCLTIVLFISFATPILRKDGKNGMPGNREISELARWADESTWAGSVFLFPDASQGTFPSTFRAISRRALWVDWSSGLQVNSSQALADEWWRRWEDTMAKPLTPGRLQPMLALPIDYYVLQKRHQLTAVSPSFTTTNLVVYDADALRSAHASSARQ